MVKCERIGLFEGKESKRNGQGKGRISSVLMYACSYMSQSTFISIIEFCNFGMDRA